MSISFGHCEDSASSVWADLWQRAAAEGISVFVSSGDSGSAGCDPQNSTTAKGGLAVNGIASTPYNVAVGGTQFNEKGADSVYWHDDNSAAGASAKSYIPEVVWNEYSHKGLWSSGGGVSRLYATPSWQIGFGVPAVDPGTNEHHRYVPDISLSAAGNHVPYIIVQGGFLGYLLEETAGGTSAASPAFAGIMALVNQVTNQSNGNPNPRLYALAAQLPSAFHDVITGSNAVPCAIGSPDCIDGLLSGYNAGPGYDLATGWGSVDAYVLAHGWTAVAPTTKPLAITSSASLPSGSTGVFYSLALTATGGTTPYRWNVVSGSLPPGLGLNTSGLLSGTPSAAGAYSFNVQVIDNYAARASQALQVTIAETTTGPGVTPGTGLPSATANTYHLFPLFADGRLNDGSFYRTTLMISNPNAGNGTTCALQPRGLAVPGFALNYQIPPSGWVIATTSSAQSFQSGYATLRCTASVEAQLLYAYYLANGIKLSEATVFSSPPGSIVKVLADEREGARLGLSIANDSDQSVTYTILVGGATGTGTVTLPPRTSVAKYLNEFVAGIPSNNVAEVQVSAGSNGKASVVGLRSTGAIFTTIPESLANSVGSTASTYHIFPIVADGKFSDGSYFRTTRMYINPNSTATANCTTQLRGLTTDGRNTFTASLLPGAAVIAPTNGTQAFQSGYASMQCSSSVDAQALYSYYSPEGVKLSEATVFSSPLGQVVQILADSREGAQVGLAIANDTDQPNTYTITVYDANGKTVGTATQQLPPRTSIAKMVNDFVTLPPNHFGQVIVSSSGAASIIGLRFSGSAFTTIPETIRSGTDDATTTSPVVSVTRAYATDTNNVERASFSPGQTIRLYMDRTNGFSSQIAVDARYKATGPSSYVLTDSIVSGATAPAGPHSRYIEVSIPQNAPAGTYTFEASVTYNGVTSRKTATFTVVIPAIPAPTLISVSPNSANTGSTVTVTLTGNNFISGRTILNVSGTGITVGSLQVTGATSLTVTLTIDSTANAGDRLITVTTSGGTSNGVTFTVVAASSSSSFNRSQTERLIGTWRFSYTIISTFTDTFRLNQVRESTITPGQWNIFGTDQFGGQVLAGYSPTYKNFTLYDSGIIIDEFFVFEFTGADSVAGCYYQVSPPGSTNLSRCYSMTGTRISPSSIITESDLSTIGNAASAKMIEAQIDKAERNGYGAEDKSVVQILQEQRRILKAGPPDMQPAR